MVEEQPAQETGEGAEVKAEQAGIEETEAGGGHGDHLKPGPLPGYALVKAPWRGKATNVCVGIWRKLDVLLESEPSLEVHDTWGNSS